MDCGNHGATAESTPSGTPRLVPVPDVDALDAWLPQPGLVILFLHDPGCPTSRAAYQEVARLGAEVALIDVRRARAVSAHIEMRTGVRHESPQLILLRDGRAVWSPAHRAITTETVARACGMCRSRRASAHT